MSKSQEGSLLRMSLMAGDSVTDASTGCGDVSRGNYFITRSYSEAY